MTPFASYTEDTFSFSNFVTEYPEGTITAPEIISVTPEAFTDDGLEPGATSVGVPWDFINYPGGMQVMVLTGDGNASNILTIYPPNTVTAPSDLGVTINDDGTYTFSWTDSPSGTIDRIVDIGANMRGDAVAGDLMYEGNYVANGSPVDPASLYTDSGSPGGLYVMSAYNVDGSGYGVNSTILDLANPAAPTNIAAAALGAAGIGVTWTDNAFNESGYTIQRSSDGGSTWTTLSSSLAADTEYYQDTSAVPGTSYQYRVNSNRTNALGAVSSVWDPTALISAPASGPLVQLQLVTLRTDMNQSAPGPGIPATSKDITIKAVDIDTQAAMAGYTLTITPRVNPGGGGFTTNSPPVTTGSNGKATFTLTINNGMGVTPGFYYFDVVGTKAGSPDAIKFTFQFQVT